MATEPAAILLFLSREFGANRRRCTEGFSACSPPLDVHGTAGLGVLICLIPTPASLPSSAGPLSGASSRFNTPSPYHVRRRGELVDDRLCTQLHHTEQPWKRVTSFFSRSELKFLLYGQGSSDTGFPSHRGSVLQDQPRGRGGCWQEVLWGHSRAGTAGRRPVVGPEEKEALDSPAKKLPISKVHHSIHIMSMPGTASRMKEPQSRRQSLVQPAGKVKQNDTFSLSSPEREPHPLPNTLRGQ